MTKEQFMKRTIAAHELRCLSEEKAAFHAPSETAMIFAVMRGELKKPEPNADKNELFSDRPFYPDTKRARYLRDTTNWFERRDKLVSENDYIYPPLKAFEKSFDKWLALQEHDVEAVNSLHEWKKELDYRRLALYDETDGLEEMAMISVTKPYVESALARKESELREVVQLMCDIDKAIEKVRSSNGKRNAA